MFAVNGSKHRFIAKTLSLLMVWLLSAHSSQAVWGAPQPQENTPAKESLAWQLEEFLQWLIKTRNLVPQGTTEPEALLTLQQLTLGGSVDKNIMTFTLTGQMVGTKPQRIPLFGNPRQVILRNVLINGKPAMLGFEAETGYFVRSGDAVFTIQGDLSLVSGYELGVRGPVCLVSAKFSEGALMEGAQLAGADELTLHLMPGKTTETAKASLPPIFMVSRSIRIGKEINFEYQARIRSTEKIPSFTFPLTFSEEVLQVKDYPDVRQEGNQLTIPVTMQDTTFTIRGRMKSLTVFEPDSRSNYEWWLIESDPEHQVTIKTEGRQMDISESPITPQLSHARLYLLTKGQRIEITQTELTPMEALAVAVSNQTRQAAWTEKGQLIAWDQLLYENNGLEYLPMNCGGKPLYVETDSAAQKILSAEKDKKETVMLPLKKGRHNSRIQSIATRTPGLLWGALTLPNATHPLTVSQGYYQLSLPERIIPIWLSGDGFQFKAVPLDIIAVITAILLGLLFFSGRVQRTAAIITLFGLYMLNDSIYWLLISIVVILGLFRLLRVWLQRTKIRKLWIISGSAVLLIAFLAAFWMFIAGGMRYDEGLYLNSKGVGAPMEAPGISNRPSSAEQLPPVGKEEGYYESEPKPDTQQLQNQELDEIYLKAEANMSKGIIPVALPMPVNTSRTLTTDMELITPEQPFTPTLFYITRTLIIPLFLLWISALLYVGYTSWPFFQAIYGKLKAIKENSPSTGVHPAPQDAAASRPSAPAPEVE